MLRLIEAKLFSILNSNTHTKVTVKMAVKNNFIWKIV